MKRFVTTALLLVGASALTDSNIAIVEATHDVTEHCAADPNADQHVDIFDLVQFAGAFGQPNPPPHLDIHPELQPDGAVSIIGEIAMVAGHFSEACWGTVEQELEPSIPPPPGPAVWDCDFQMGGFWPGTTSGGGQFGLAWISQSGGRSGCLGNSEPASEYLSFCEFTFEYLDPNGNWYGVVSSPETYQQGIILPSSNYMARWITYVYTITREALP